ncbi:hypothetical protein ACJMK2_016185 [Sinanodonta woodiana]|uniref:Uncharacterized protein n=1 Tax=Sinanodonta woodiana TaxID=1069815 RepID=A0ABD3USU2_SINWO
MFGVDLVSSGHSSYLIVEECDSTPNPSTILGASDDRVCIARLFHSDNRTEIEICLYQDSFNSITGQSGTTHHPLAMSRPCETDRPVRYWISQKEYEIASRNGGSDEFVTPAVPQSSDADRTFVNINVSNASSEHVIVQPSDLLFLPYSRFNFPRPYKFIFSTRKHFLPREAELTP